MSDLLTTSEVARMLDCTPATVASLVKRGLFPGASKLDPSLRNSPLRIPRKAVENYMKQFQEPETSGSPEN